MSNNVFFEPPLSLGDGPFSYATFGVARDGRPQEATQVIISDTALEAFAAEVKRQSPADTDIDARGLLVGYLTSKLRDWIDAEQPLYDVFKFVTRPTEGAVFLLDPIDIGVFLKARNR